jgi:predicted nucleic acid-binding protein
MKRKILTGVLFGFMTLAVSSQVFAFTCPVLIKAAGESIAKAEAAAEKVTDEREKARATTLIAMAKDLVKQAEANHKEAGAKKDAQLHYNAESQAKAAKALADAGWVK